MVVQAGLQLTPGQQTTVLEVRDVTLLWLQKAAALRLQAYDIIRADRAQLKQVHTAFRMRYPMTSIQA